MPPRQSRKNSDKARSAANEQAASKAKKSGQEQFEQSKSLRRVHDDAIVESFEELKIERDELIKKGRKYKNPNNTKSAEIQRRLLELDNEASKLEQLREALQRVPDDKLADEINAIGKRITIPRYFKKIAGALGRVAGVAGFIVGLINFRSTAAEEGVGRAVIDTIPVLSEVVSLSEDYVTMHTALQETVEAYDLADRIESETDRKNARFTQRTALSWYKEEAATIEITDLSRIDLIEIGRAVRSASNEVSLLLSISDRLSREERQQRIDRIKAGLRERLRAAANQSQSSLDEGGGLI